MAILHTMWQRISGKTINAEPTQAEPAFTALQKALLSLHPEQCEQPNQYLPLQQLRAQRQIIEVKIDGSSQSYQTLILAIDVARGLLWLDDLFPNQRLLKAGDTITLRHHRNSEQLCFSSPVVALGNSFGANGLAILLPEFLSYQPRRQHHRYDLSGDSSLSVKIRPVGYEPSYGSIQDLSLGGSALRVAGNLTGQLRHGALLPVCELHLSDGLLIRCSARIRAFSIARSPRRHTLISVEFIDLNAESRHQLQQFLYKIAHSEEIKSQQLELDKQSELILRTA